MLNLFVDTGKGIRGEIALNSRQPAVPLHITSCAALVYKESITADKFLKVSVELIVELQVDRITLEYSATKKMY